MKVLLQVPSLVQPISMSIFMEASEPYSLDIADRNILLLAESLQQKGYAVSFLTDALFHDVGPHVTKQDLVSMAQKALRFDEGVSQARISLASEHLLRCTRAELATIILSSPKLALIPDDELGDISPDLMYETYEIQPLFGLMFPRDHYINVGGQPIFGRLRRQDRQREVEVVKRIVEAHGQKVTSFDCHLEGGDYQENDSISIIGHGFRTDSVAVKRLLDSNLLNKNYLVSVEDRLKNNAQFHLDHYVCLLNNTLLVDSSRADSIEASTVIIYERIGLTWQRLERQFSLSEAAAFLDLKVVKLDHSQMAAWAANSFALDRHIWMNDNVPHCLKNKLHAMGYEVHILPFSEHIKQFGGIHCATQII